MRIGLTIALLSLFTTSFSQFYLGPEIGVNLIPADRNEIVSNYHLGIHSGLRTSYYFADYFSIQSGIYYTQKSQLFSDADTSPVDIFGFNIEDLGIPGTDFNQYSKSQSSVRQSYIQIPLQASYSIKGFTASAGLYFGFMISAWTKTETYTEVPFMKLINIEELDPTGILGILLPAPETTTFEETSSKEYLKGFDMGLKTTLSYQPENFGVHLSYQYGFSDYRIESEEDDIIRHSYFQLSLSYLFGFGSQEVPSSRF